MLNNFSPIPVFDVLTENQISANCRFIEIIKVFKINEIIAYTKVIHATYRILKCGVKL
jgi:hypothetical protein